MKPLNLIRQTAFMLVTALLMQFVPGLTSPALAVLPNPFEKTGEQLDCDYVRFQLFFTREYNGFVKFPAEIAIRDILPEGLSIETATISGDVTGPAGGPVPAYDVGQTTNPLDTIDWKNLYLTSGNAGVRSFTVTILAKIDRSKFPVAKMISNQAVLKTTWSNIPVTFKSNNPDIPIGIGEEGNPTQVLIDVTNCHDDTGGGDPVGEACFKVEHGEIECDPHGLGVFTYKMTIGPEYGGKVIELVATTPGVSIFPPSQIVPAGGGVLIWQIHGAVPGMTVHLVANGLTDGDVKHVSGPSEGLGLCCIQKIEIIIPIDLDCPHECKPDDPWCKPHEGEPKLQLEKYAENPICAKEGGGNAECFFKIRITNIGTATYNGPITVRDSYPNGAPIESEFSPPSPWVCGPDGGADKFVCNRNINLPPGAFTTLGVETVVSIAGYPSRDVKNCALLEEQAGSPKRCAIAKLPDPKPKLKLEKAAAPFCDAQGDGTAQCFFSIRITNIGSATYNGPLTVRDNYPNGAPIDSEFNPAPPWVCGPDGGADKFVCNHNINLLAGVSTTIRVKTTVSIAGYPSRDVKNCALLEEQTASPKSCGIAKLPDPEQPDLSVAKTCGNSNGNSIVPCRVSVTNNGFVTPSEPVTLNDLVTIVGGGAHISFSGIQVDDNNDWLCGRPAVDNFHCTIDGAKLTPGTTRWIDVFFKFDTSEQRYENCVEGFLGAGDANPIGKKCVQGGSAPIGPDDPNDISVEKTGPATCVPDEPCVFQITLTNKSDKDFNGQMAIVDGITNSASGDLTSGAQVVSITPPFGCDVTPTSLPFGCVATLSLGARASRTHTVSVIPSNIGLSGQNPESQNSMKNCVLIGEAGILSADVGETLEGAGSADANQGSPRYACHEFIVEEPASCFAGMVLNDDGNCQCPAGTNWKRTSCVGDDPIIPPLGGTDPVCPRGWDQFRSQKGKPLGYYVKKVRGNGKTIYCGEPRCASGWKLYRNGSAIPKGWTKKHIGRPNSKYKFWCAKPVKQPPLYCWGDDWTQISSSQIKSYRAKGYSVKPRVKSGKTIWCARPVEDPTPQCWSGWKKISDTQIRWHEKNGYDVKPRGKKGVNRIWCAKRTTTPPLQCWSGWSKIWLGEVNSYRKKRYMVKRRGKGKSAIWCVKPPESQSCVLGPNEYRNSKYQCVCKRNYKRNKAGVCVKSPVCKKPWQQIMPHQVKSYKNKGWKVKHLGGRGFIPVICAKPGNGPQCKRPNEIWLGSDGCVCKRGYQRDRYNRCVKKPPQNNCKSPRFTNSSGICTCGRNKRYNRKYNRCDVIEDPKPKCVNGRVTGANGDWFCSCPSGWKRQPIKGGTRCLRPDTNSCQKPRFKNSSGRCTCGPNKRYIAKLNRCIRDIVDPFPRCPKGSIGKRPNCKCYGNKRYNRKTNRCDKVVIQKPVCYGGTLRGARERWYCSCPKGWKRKSIGNKGGARCQRPTGPTISCLGGVVLKSSSRATAPSRCSCPKGKRPTRIGKNRYRCVSTGPVCSKYQRKVGKRCLPIRCGKGFIGNKPNCRPIVARTCAKIGKIGKWPNCRNKVRKTCAKIGKIGKWPNCRNKVRKTCAKIGKIGKWPNCRKKPVIKYVPGLKYKPKGTVIK